MMADTYFFGRGSGNCLAVQIVPGNYARVFVGSGKTGEAGEYMMMSRQDFFLMADFFRSLHTLHGQDILAEPVVDDPHDEVEHNLLDMDTVERFPIEDVPATTLAREIARDKLSLLREVIKKRE